MYDAIHGVLALISVRLAVTKSMSMLYIHRHQVHTPASRSLQSCHLIPARFNLNNQPHRENELRAPASDDQATSARAQKPGVPG